MTGSDDAAEAPSARERSGHSGAATLESFVAQLHREGVEMGKREAEERVRAAEAEAASIIESARSEAAEIVAEARRAAEAAGSRGRAELELAVRDAILQLQAALTAVLRELVTGAVDRQLAGEDQLKALVLEVVGAYARADADGRPSEFRVPAGTARRLEAWWAQELGSQLAEEGRVPALVGTLAEAGFEYRLGAATVEVSTESVVEKLMELVRPGLRGMVEEAATEAVEQAAPGASVPPGLVGAGRSSR